MSGATILSYLQMSHFLMLIMVMSWLLSTYFFLPLCAAAGPIRNFGQLTCAKMEKAQNSVKKSVRSTIRRRGSSAPPTLPMESVFPHNIEEFSTVEPGRRQSKVTFAANPHAEGRAADYVDKSMDSLEETIEENEKTDNSNDV